jgi:hypothetical protein
MKLYYKEFNSGNGIAGAGTEILNSKKQHLAYIWGTVKKPSNPTIIFIEDYNNILIATIYDCYQIPNHSKGAKLNDRTR